MIRIAIIVEGDGEILAVPVLLRRLAEHLGYPGQVQICNKLRVPASRLVRPGELERAVELSARKLGGTGGIFVLLDADDACPATAGPTLATRARSARPDLPSAVVLAKHEYESWFLGSAASLAGKRGLPFDLTDHPNPEKPRGCKEWLSAQLPPGRRYRELEDQAAFTSIFDIDQAVAACDSFEKLYREANKLFQALTRPRQTD